ncbi:MAG: alanine racemase [bacterium]|nr:alanine racemase [bacterium]
MTDPIDAPVSRLVIDLEALTRNWQALARMVRPAECAGVVKADAYGLGAVQVARSLAQAGCRRFFVANPDGAAALRSVLDETARVYVLNGLIAETGDLAARNMVPVLNDLGQITRWADEARRLERRLGAVVHIDTGMSRLGLPPAETARLAASPELLAPLDLHFMMSHLSCASEPEEAENHRQLELFRHAMRSFPGVRASLANSSGIFLGDAWHHDLVRPGYAVYGGNPTPSGTNPMEAVIRLKARIIQVREVPAGTRVGYGGTYTTERATRLATVPVGYADGYPRALGNLAHAFIGDHTVPVVGHVSMDLMTLDIGGLPEAKAHVGTWVDLIRGRAMLDDLAGRAGTIGYELLTSLGARYARQWLGGTH